MKSVAKQKKPSSSGRKLLGVQKEISSAFFEEIRKSVLEKDASMKNNPHILDAAIRDVLRKVFSAGGTWLTGAIADEVVLYLNSIFIVKSQG